MQKILENSKSMDVFSKCKEVHSLIISKKEKEARDLLIQILDYLDSNNEKYTPLVNHLIRETGLYPYLQLETANWEDKYVYEAFKVDAGDIENITLHREQSYLLRKLIEGNSIAVSAPTSFGKSFVIDAYISIKKPKNIVIIVPTIALMDETRRRLYKKFASEYNLITTADVELSDKNIFIFPQERAINYANKIDNIDILIIDEFYKADVSFDKDRAPILLKTILELGKKARQRYFLAPNIDELKESPITESMDFEKIDFNTVYSDIHHDYKDNISGQEFSKSEKLISILKERETKTLIYAGTFTNIDAITKILQKNVIYKENPLLESFSDWIKINYGETYILADLVKRGIGIHNGRLHRALSQIQIKLFEEDCGLDNIISTSSIVEGVNTSAENVIVWANKNGKPNLNDFTYKNIIGRGGRMFRHFIGRIHLFEAPPSENRTQLELDFPDNLLNSLDESRYNELTREQIIKIIAFNDEMDNLLGPGVYKSIKNDQIQSCDASSLRNISTSIKLNSNTWGTLGCLNSDNPQLWENTLFHILKSVPIYSSISHSNYVEYVKSISNNWSKTIPDIINSLQQNEITIEKYFELEKSVSFKLSSLLSDINIIQKHVLQSNTDISSFISKISHAFLPKLVYDLEEYGLPRMLSRKIQSSGIIDLEDENISINDAIRTFNKIGISKLEAEIKLHPFEEYILNYFYDGITPKKHKA